MQQIHAIHDLLMFSFVVLKIIAGDAALPFHTWYRTQKDGTMASVNTYRFGMAGLPMARILDCLAQCSVNQKCEVATLDKMGKCVLTQTSSMSTANRTEDTLFHKIEGTKERRELNDEEPIPPSDITRKQDDKGKSECPTEFGHKFELPRVDRRTQLPSCYLRIKKSLNWTAAEQECKETKGFLLTIESEEEQKHIKELFSRQIWPIDYYWLSLSYNPETKIWYWASTGKPVCYSKWFIGQPIFSQPKPFCGVLNSFLSSDWGNGRCHFKFGVICETFARS